MFSGVIPQLSLVMGPCAGQPHFHFHFLHWHHLNKLLGA